MIIKIRIPNSSFVILHLGTYRLQEFLLTQGGYSLVCIITFISPANQQVDSSVWNQNIMNTTHNMVMCLALHCFVDFGMNTWTHLLIKFIPSYKEVLPILFMFNPSQFYMTFVQHIYTCKGEWYCVCQHNLLSLLFPVLVTYVVYTIMK